MSACLVPVFELAFCAEVSDAGKASQDQQEGEFDLYDIPGVDTRFAITNGVAAEYAFACLE